MQKVTTVLNMVLACIGLIVLFAAPEQVPFLTAPIPEHLAPAIGVFVLRLITVAWMAAGVAGAITLMGIIGGFIDPAKKNHQEVILTLAALLLSALMIHLMQ